MRLLTLIIVLIMLIINSTFAQSESLTLDNCIQIALKNNPYIIRSINLNKSADEDVLGSYAGIMPTISLSASTGRAEAGQS